MVPARLPLNLLAMFDLSSVAGTFLLCQWLLALLGLGLVSAWYLAPQLQPLRRSPPLVPAWDASLADTLLVSWIAVCAFGVGSLMAGSLFRQFSLTTGNGWTSVLSAFGFQGAVTIAVALFSVYRRLAGRPLPPAGRRPPAPLTDRLLLGAAVFCIALPFVVGASYLSNAAMEALGIPIHLQDLAGFFNNGSSPALLLALTFVTVVLAPLGEEILFRAGLFRFARCLLPRWAALLLSSLAFASLHLNLVHFLPLTVLGLILALAYEKSGSLLVPVVAHALFNLTSILNLLAGVGGSP
ncbi:MAG TPA: CPBP family intramembrane metalloprotease [Opitutaceae bacterium]|nr:CPBP family intramembrane metalloprotease [Opitutaceae bacterium]